MKRYLGCDVGLSGALAYYDPLTRELEIIDMPTLEIKVNNKKKRQIDLYTLAREVDARKNDTRKAVVELVGTMPGQGITSSFNFGFSAGCMQMVIASNFIPMMTVSPRVWKKAMSVTADKDTAFREASRLLPHHSGKWNLKKHDGRVEATLLAIYAAQTDKNRSVEDIL